MWSRLFIKTPLGRTPTDPIVVAQPPRLLEILGLAERMELWGLIKALYGLREAPMLWGNFRDDTLRKLELPRGLTWTQGKAVTAWWSIRDQSGEVQAIVVVYVDDFMICGPRFLVNEIGAAIQEVWDTSELSFLGPGNSIRFLGMELQRMEEDAEEIHVFQQGYISELLRLHEIKESQLDKVPITKELAWIPDEVEGLSAQLVRDAQQLTGEVLWVTQRTRPDLSYACSMMATLSTKNPQQAVDAGRKALGYLRRTIGYGLRIRWEPLGLVMYSDAAYAPQGGRSHGGWLVAYGSVPLAWRSGRQSMITLSTAEAELLAIIDGAVALKGIEAILSDVGEQVSSRCIASDSTSALSITTGASSWRTRHLRIKAGWLQEQISHGIFVSRHCPGEVQPADLLTKALSSGRIEHLLRLWGIGPYDNSRAAVRAAVRAPSRIMVALICCLLMVSVRAAEDGSGGGRERSPGLQLDHDAVGILMALLMVLGAMMLWEGIRWVFIEAVTTWMPGSSKRKLRRLQRLQAATTEAIERELERLQLTEDSAEDVQRSSASSSSTTRGTQVQGTRRTEQGSTITARQRMQEEDHDGQVRRQMRMARTPSPRPPRVTPDSSPSIPESQDDVTRVAHDLCMLMTVEALKEGLRTEGLAVSGLKDAQAWRLGYRLSELSASSRGPTSKQMKFILWLWRVKDMQNRHQLRYCEVNDKSRISALIQEWNNR